MTRNFLVQAAAMLPYRSAIKMLLLLVMPGLVWAQLPALSSPRSAVHPANIWRVESHAVHVTTALRKFSARELTYTLRSRALWRLPHRQLAVRVASNIGSLQSDGRSDVLLGVGPLLEYRPRQLRSRALLELGSGVHWIDGDGFADEQLGQRLQFQSHLALGLSPGRRRLTAVMLRVQHISNAGLAEHNPGLDLIGLELRHRFGGG